MRFGLTHKIRSGVENSTPLFLPFYLPKIMTIKKEIQFYKKNVYGNENIYLKNDEDCWILGLTQTATLLPRHIANLKYAGFEFVQVFED